MPIVIAPPSVGEGSGSTELALLGSGNAQPGGIESTFEYNGLLLNNRAAIDTYIITSIDGFGDADVRDQRQTNPNYHGETPFNAWYGGRSIAVSGKIRAFNVKKLRDMQESLKLAFSSLEEKPLRISSNFTKHDVQINCRKNQSLVMNEVQQNFQFTRDFLIPLRAADPRFRSIQQSIIDGENTGTLINPLEIINEGNSPAQPVYTIAGPVNNLLLTNIVTGDTMKLNGMVADGEFVVIDILKRTIVDDSGNNKFNMFDIDSNWMEIVPGTNTVDVTGTSINFNTHVTVSLNHTWL